MAEQDFGQDLGKKPGSRNPISEIADRISSETGIDMQQAMDMADDLWKRARVLFEGDTGKVIGIAAAAVAVGALGFYLGRRSVSERGYLRRFDPERNLDLL